MRRLAASIVVAGVCACSKHEDAAPRAEPVATTAPTASEPAAIGSAQIQEMVALLHSAAAAEPEPEPDAGAYRIGDPNIHVPSVRQGTVTVQGRLAPEVIQRVVRRNFGRFRFCYENDLKTDPKLAGTVATKLVIDPRGNVTSATRDARTTLTDVSVVACVTNAFTTLSFPEPEGGIVIVSFPIIFGPSD